jgi:hypothetical protein
MTASLRDEERTIEALSLDSGLRKTLVRGGTHPRYSATGHLLYARGSTLMMASFDPQRLEVGEPEVPVLAGVLGSRKGSGQAIFDVSDNGALVYVPREDAPPKRELLWVDRKGATMPLVEASHPYSNPSLSPDGKRLAVTIDGATDAVWIYDLEKKTWTRFASHGDSGDPVWTSDGRSLIFSAAKDGQRSIFRAPYQDAGRAEPLATGPNWAFPTSVSPGGLLAFTSFSPVTDYDLGLFDLDGGQPRSLLATSSSEGHGVLSPDGRWLAYTSNASGNVEVYVRPIAGTGSTQPVSRGPGVEPVWARDGREVFYRSGHDLMAVAITLGTALHVGAPRRLFSADFEPQLDTSNRRRYDAAADGQRFVMIRAGVGENALLQVVVIPDWFQEVRARLAGTLSPSAETIGP